MYTNKMEKAEKQVSTHDMSISVQISAGHCAKEGPEIVVTQVCVDFKKMMLLVANNVGCGYTPGVVIPHLLPLSIMILKQW